MQSGSQRCHKGQRCITLIRDITAGQVFAHHCDTALFLSPSPTPGGRNKALGALEFYAEACEQKAKQMYTQGSATGNQNQNKGLEMGTGTHAGGENDFSPTACT